MNLERSRNLVRQQEELALKATLVTVIWTHRSGFNAYLSVPSQAVEGTGCKEL